MILHAIALIRTIIRFFLKIYETQYHNGSEKVKAYLGPGNFFICFSESYCSNYLLKDTEM